MDSKQVIEKCRQVLTQRSPVAMGRLPVSHDACSLFYKQGDSVRYLNTMNATNEQLELLTSACQVATFGRGGEDIIDETYRRVGKLDSQDFSCKLNDEITDIIELVRPLLLDENSVVKHELYKLNVYGKDSFFKSHKDTPRSEHHFGSLVIVLPAPHTGGTLRFTHQSSEWSLDSGTDLAKLESPAISYAAFYSDVEHEVLPVTGGHRITITYILYFSSRATGLSTFNLRKGIEDLSQLLRHLASDESFLPEGGMLGFGLQHQYPRAKGGIISLDDLKGNDAILLRACRDLGYKIQVKTVLDPSSRIYMNSASEDQLLYLSDVVPDFESAGELESIHESMGEIQGVLELQGRQEDHLQGHLVWVTNLTHVRQSKEPYVSYGSEAQLNFFYVDLCLVVLLGKPDSRHKPVHMAQFQS